MDARSRVTRWALALACKKPAPRLIPRSGDCFSVRLTHTSTASILVSGLSSKGVSGDCWSGQSFEWPCSVPNERLGEFEFAAERYWGLTGLTYHSGAALLIGEAIGWPRIPALQRRLRQWLFNATTRIRTDRMIVLRACYDETNEVRQSPLATNHPALLNIDSGTVLRRLHGNSIWSHPNFRRSRIEIDMILDSWTATGELRKHTTGYVLEPIALKAIADYQEAERKQRTSQTQAWWTIGLTVFVAVATGVQAWAAWKSISK